MEDVQGALQDESVDRATLADDAGDCIFRAFEAGVTARLEQLVGHELGNVGVKGRVGKGPTARVHVRRAPWFGAACRAAKAAWKARVRARESADSVAAARRAYRRTCKRSRAHFEWRIDRLRVHHAQ